MRIKKRELEEFFEEDENGKDWIYIPGIPMWQSIILCVLLLLTFLFSIFK